MFVDPQLHLYLVVVAALFYFLLPTGWVRAKQVLLISVSLLLVMYAAPVAGLIALALSIFVALIGPYISEKRCSKLVYRGSLLIPISVIFLFDFVLPQGGWYEKLGSSYFAIKSLTVLIDCHKAAIRPNFRQVLLLNLWFPIYSAGPIERADTFRDEVFAARVSLVNLYEGGARIVVGLFKSIFLAKELLSPFVVRHYGGLEHVIASGDWGLALTFILLSFLILYVSFSGYTDVAIGTSKIFGISIRENFDKPFLATSVQNFWQRWHLSLSQTVSRYLFKPLVRATGKPALAIFTAFTVIGLWHDLSLTYLMWGIFHGGALAVNLVYGRFCKGKLGLVAFHSNFFVRLCSCAITLTYIAWVSAVANAPDFDTGLQLTLTLIGR